MLSKVLTSENQLICNDNYSCKICLQTQDYPLFPIEHRTCVT